MARSVCVHGIGSQLSGEAGLLKDWLPALTDGLTRAEATGAMRASEVAAAFYGDVFRPPGELLAVDEPPYTAADVEDGFEDLRTLRPIGQPLIGHTDAINAAICMEIDGTPTAVTAGSDQTVRIWNLRTGACLDVIPTGTALAVALSATDDLVVGINSDIAVFQRKTHQP